MTGAHDVGGLVAYNKNGSVANTYATGSVSGSSYVGGLVAVNSGTVSSSYATGGVSGTGNDVGGLVGYNLATVSNSFWNITTSGLTTSAGGRGMTTAQMQTEANFTSATSANGEINPGWNFTTIWYMPSGSYPLLQVFKSTQ